MITNDRNPHPPDGEEPLEELFRSLFDLADETVTRITEGEVDARLRRLLDRNAWRDAPGMTSGADIPQLEVEVAAAQTAESVLTRARSRAQAIVAAARREAQEHARQIDAQARAHAECILREARSYDDAALERAARIVADARGQAASIIADARADAEGITMAARAETAACGRLAAYGHPGARLHAPLAALLAGGGAVGSGVPLVISIEGRPGRAPDVWSGRCGRVIRSLRRLLSPRARSYCLRIGAAMLGASVSADRDYISALDMWLLTSVLPDVTWTPGRGISFPQHGYERAEPDPNAYYVGDGLLRPRQSSSGAPTVSTFYGAVRSLSDDYAPRKAGYVASDGAIQVVRYTDGTYRSELGSVSVARDEKCREDVGNGKEASFGCRPGGLLGS